MQTYRRYGESVSIENEGLPDSNRPSGLCPRCGKQSSFDYIGSLPVTLDYESSYVGESGLASHDFWQQVTSLLCRHCGQGVAVVEEQYVGEAPAKHSRGSGTVSYRGVHWWPLPDATPSSDIPSQIAEAFAEASTTLMAQCPRAAAVMSRRTLEAIAEDKGETKGNLSQRLTALDEKGILHSSLAEWVKEVRLIGNTGAHFDPIQKVSMTDAQQLVSFVRQLLEFIYVLPAELERRRAAN